METENDRKHKNAEFCKQMWLKYEIHLRKICMRKLSGNPVEVDDVISDTYLILCEAVDNDKKFKNPKAWIYATVNNRIKRKYTELKKRKERQKDISDMETQLSYNVDFIEEIAKPNINELRAKVESSLTEPEKQLLEFVYVDKLNSKQIAGIINSTETAVKQRRYRLVKKIKMLISDECEKIYGKNFVTPDKK